MDEIRIGLDFGTSTTVVAARIGDREPRVLRLEASGDELPSYIAPSPDGLIFGTAAKNAGISAHSIKLLIPENLPVPQLDGMPADHAAFQLVAEAVRRALEALKREGRLPPEADRLEVASNIGCTPRFDLTARKRLRDICAAAGLNVRLANLVEEPVAAGFEIAYSGLGEDGSTMVIDIGGGTLDVAVMYVTGEGDTFVIHATGGAPLGGDRFTELIVNELTREMEQRSGSEAGEMAVDRQTTTALWNRAEAAKVALSTNAEVRVALPLDSTSEVVITRTWFERSAQKLLLQIVEFVSAVYRQSRLTLDRGGHGDRYPGTTRLRYDDHGFVVEKVERLKLNDDGIAHLRNVYLVGGPSRMPLLRDKFSELLGDRLKDLELVQIDPVHVVALGLARHQRLSRVDIRFPNWGINAHVQKQDGSRVFCPMYEPFAPAFRLDPFRGTSSYTYRVLVPQGGDGGTVSLSFRPVAQTAGERWHPVPIPDGARELSLELDLFGRLKFMADETPLYPGQSAPFALHPPKP